MKPVSRRQLFPATLIALSLLALASAGAGCGGECDDVGATWCDGNTVQECYRSGGGGHRSATNLIKSEECAEKKLVCSAETGKARCVFEAKHCADKPSADAVCVGSVRASCQPGASQPVPDKNCAGQGPNTYCVESEQTARCSGFPEPCAEDAPHRCVSGRALSCVDQIYLAPSDSGVPCYGECNAQGSMQCMESRDDLGQPYELAATCKNGVWLSAGDACQAECSCEGEPPACRCSDWPASFQPL